MTVFVVIGACAACALAGFIGGCLAACYDHVSYRKYESPACINCCENRNNYA